MIEPHIPAPLARLLLTVALVISALLLAVGTALPQQGNQSRGETGQGHICFFAMDKDRDGYVSLEEFTAAYGEDAADEFAAQDADGDGLLVHEDYHIAE